MNIGGLAMQAFGGAVKELDGKGKEDVRAVFRQVWFSRGRFGPTGPWLSADSGCQNRFLGKT